MSNFAGLYATSGISLTKLAEMAAHNEAGSTADPASGAGREWLGHSVFQVPELEISRIRSWASPTVMSYHRGAGESNWQGDRRHRLVRNPDQHPSVLFQVEQGHTWQTPLAAPGTLAFFMPTSRSGSFNPQRGSFRWSGMRICIPPCCRSSERQHPSSNYCIRCKTRCSDKSSRGWPRGPMAASRTGSDRKPGHCLMYPYRSALRRAPSAADQQGSLARAAAARARLYRGTSRSRPLAHDPRRHRLSQRLSLQPLVQAGDGRRAASLRHPTPARTGEDINAPDQSTAGSDCTGTRLCRPEPSERCLSPRDRYNTGPVRAALA